MVQHSSTQHTFETEYGALNDHLLSSYSRSHPYWKHVSIKADRVAKYIVNESLKSCLILSTRIRKTIQSVEKLHDHTLTV